MKWVFPPNNGGEVDGFNNAAINHFDGRKLFSVVRETIQNSMDARSDKAKPVKVSFTLVDIPKNKAVGINELLPNLKYAEETARAQHSPEHASVRFFKNASSLIEQSAKIPVFVISDFNTTGLEGDFDDSDPNFKGDKWYALIKGSGLSQKSTDGALGSFGHGSKAPFAASALRTVFYFSEIAIGSKKEIRFQGKSILQSMRVSNGTITQGTGYFSNTDRCDPILNGNVPAWVSDLRDKAGKGTGTSIVVPFPDLSSPEDDFWQEMQISIIHNFYLAIKNKNLEIDFNGDESLNSKNLVEQFNKLIKSVEKSDPENEYGIMSELECAKTVEFPTDNKHGILVSKSFGQISWYMRTGEDISWRGVAIARQNGMLITEEPHKLKSFPGTKTFDLFLCVEGEKGSKILRSIEDPSHTRFEFERIPDLSERRAAENSYNAFTKEIRELIKEHASMDASEEQFVDDLNDFFSGAETASVEEGKVEISNRLTLDPFKIVKARRPSSLGDDSGTGNVDEQLPQPTPGNGVSDDAGGVPAVDLEGSSSSSGKKHEIPLGDARIARSSGNFIKVYFNIDHAGPFSLSIGKVGESESQLLRYRTVSDAEWKIKRIFNSKRRGSRVSIELELETGSEKYALQLVAKNV